MSQANDDFLPPTRRQVAVAFFAAIALPALVALTDSLGSAVRLWDNESVLPEGQVAVDTFVRQWDIDRDGVLSRDELRTAVGSRLDHLIEKLFRAADKNRDGKLDADELHSLAGENFYWLLRSNRKSL
jgi:hypothetical protein